MFAFAPASPGGSGYAVAAERFIGLLSTDASPGLVEALYRLLDQPDTRVTDVLDLLARSGAAEAFAVIEVVDASRLAVNIVLRGDVMVDLGGPTVTRFRWPADTTWVSGEATGVETVRVSLPGKDHAAELLPLGRGAVPASVITIDLAPNAAHAALPEVPTDPPTTAIALPLPAIAEPVATQQPVPIAPDRTPQRINLAAMLAPPSWTLVLPDGNELEAASRIVVGRRPWRTSQDETSTYYVLAPSPKREISGKHIELAVVGEELHARDLNSTNGTLVLAEDKPPHLLQQSDSVNLRTGDTLDLGEGFRMVVGTRK